MSDIKIGDKVVGIKGATRVTGTVMNIKEGHVHIKAPVSGVYAPLVSIVPMHKVAKLNEGAMKRKAEDEDDGGMSDYMHHVQTSAPFDNAKPAKPHADKFGNKIKIGNVARNLAKQGMSGVKKEEVEQIDEVEVTPTPAHKLNPGLRARIDAASKTQKPRQAGTPSIDKIKLITRKEEVEQVDEAGIMKKVGRSLAGWGAFDKDKPRDVVKNTRSMSNDMLSQIAIPRKNTLRSSPAALQQKVAKRELAKRNMGEEVEQVEEGYRARRAFGTAYDKMHDPFKASNRAFKTRELQHELGHEDHPTPRHHDQTPHDVHIDGKKWKTFGSAAHAHNVANKLSISGKKASVHKTPIAEKAPPGWEGTVKAMKKHPEIDNPYALAWWMKRKGAKSHKGKK